MSALGAAFAIESATSNSGSTHIELRLANPSSGSAPHRQSLRCQTDGGDRDAASRGHGPTGAVALTDATMRDSVRSFSGGPDSAASSSCAPT